jgi:NADPH:quinone reductase-like Zn-dependent oxidoreductase
MITKAATIPLAAMTAAISLYAHHRFPPPWAPSVKPTPFIVYGASTAVGSFALKLARNSNIHPISAIAGKESHYVERLIDCSKGDTVVDYREGVEATVKKTRSSLEQTGHSAVYHAFDAVIASQSVEVLKQSVTPGGQIDFTLPNDFDVSPAVKSITSVGSVHKQPGFENNEELDFIFSRYFTRALHTGSFHGHPFEVRSRGLEGVEEALKDLKAGKASAIKYIFRIADTPGVE